MRRRSGRLEPKPGRDWLRMPAATAATLLVACGGNEAPPSEAADEAVEKESIAAAAPESAIPPPPDLTAPEAVSAIGRLLDSLLADGFASEPVLAPSGDLASIEDLAGDSLLAERFAARPRLRMGVQLRAVSDRFVTTADHRPGDPVVATLAEDVPGPGGRVLVRQGAKLLGVVTASQSAFGPGETAFLEVAFLTLATETWERPLRTRVVAVLPPEAPEPTPEEPMEGAEDQPDPAEPPPDPLTGAGDPAEGAPGEIPAGAVLVVELEETLVLPMAAADVAEMSSEIDALPSERDTIPGNRS